MPKPAKENEQLAPLIGEWSMAIVMPGQERPEPLPDLGARVKFEWMGEKAFVLERWTVPIPEILITLASVVFVGLLGGLLPALRAASLEPAEVLGRG